MIPALKFLMYPNAMTDKFYLEEAIEDLHTLLDMTRWATSRFNDAALYFGHGTDNAWDEATSLVMQALHLPHPILEICLRIPRKRPFHLPMQCRE